jgi:alkylated DNA repair dioxygenase AlkB
MFAPQQASLFGNQEPGFDSEFAALEHHDLGNDAWVDYAPGWLDGDEQLFDLIERSAAWSSPRVLMYDRVVQTPRLTAEVDVGWHPILAGMVAALSERYGMQLDRLSAGLYRTGADSVAWHGDRIARDLPHATVATVSLAGPRRFLLRPRGGGSSLAFSLGCGDLVVMGGSCQRTWEHTVPKVANARPRIALMLRHEYAPPAALD